MDFENICNTGLSLGLGSQNKDHYDHHQEKKNFSRLFPSLALGSSSAQVVDTRKLHTNLNQHAYSISAGSSFSNSSVKRGRDVSDGEELEGEKRESSKISDDQEEEGGVRKKLRLTKEQSIILEESFKEHNSLNPKQKHALAKRLNLRARQVEVWFQNRRARTKLKQTEVDCELLKKCCENLAQENRRLQKELQELKALKQKAPFYMQMPASTLTMCPSCERISTKNSSKSAIAITRKTQVIYR